MSSWTQVPLTEKGAVIKARLVLEWRDENKKYSITAYVSDPSVQSWPGREDETLFSYDGPIQIPAQYKYLTFIEDEDGHLFKYEENPNTEYGEGFAAGYARAIADVKKTLGYES